MGVHPRHTAHRRDFSKGLAFYNPTSSAVSVPFGGTYYVVAPQGGHSPKLGGTGTVAFQGPFASMVLPARRGAIVVRQPGLGR